MTGTRMRSAGIAATVCAVALIGGAVPASGDGGAKTQVIIKKLSANGASGIIKSKEAKCEGSGREVQFFTYNGYVSVKVARVHTDSHGKWKVKKNLDPGKYFAKVDSSPGCRYDTSPDETLH